MVYAKEIEEYVKKRNAKIVDIRETKLYRQSHWKDAMNLPYENQWNPANYFTKDKYVIFYCEHGGNSMLLARELGRLGYKTGSVVGGYEAMKKYFSENYFKIEENMQE